ncbi:MAG: hypothetical protein HY043_17455 [Verrucomicrobia bacterium]|nr:hypothetical protein [Verrucomicrobiota bacterium]
MVQHYFGIFIELLAAPFHFPDLIWGIVPLYFGWLINELTSDRASYKTAIQTGFGFLWAGAHWIYQMNRQAANGRLHLGGASILQIFVTLAVLAVGTLALVSGLRRKFPKRCSFLGHSRFSNYFMIAIFPMQSNCLPWSLDRLLAMIFFAAPCWLLLHLGLRPFRN